MLSCSHTLVASAGENSSNQWNQRYHGETIMQLQQVTGFQTSRTNSFDSSSCEDLIQNFISQIPNSDRAAMPLSPRKWFKIKVAFKLASVGRLSRISRRGPHCPAPRPRLVPTIWAFQEVWIEVIKELTPDQRFWSIWMLHYDDVEVDALVCWTDSIIDCQGTR